MIKLIIFDAYTHMASTEKREAVNFLINNLDFFVKKEDIANAIDLAVKDKPSFGGFVIVAQYINQTLGVLVVNRTGMEQNRPTHILTYFSLRREYKTHQIADQMLQKAITLSGYDLALYIKPGHPTLPFFEKLGFKTQKLEMRLTA